MRIAYLDCFSGISGDMFLGALVDAGVPAKLLEDAVAGLGIGARLEISRVNRSGITATKVDVCAAGAGGDLALDLSARQPVPVEPSSGARRQSGQSSTYVQPQRREQDRSNQTLSLREHNYGRSSSVEGRDPLLPQKPSELEEQARSRQRVEGSRLTAHHDDPTRIEPPPPHEHGHEHEYGHEHGHGPGHGHEHGHEHSPAVPPTRSLEQIRHLIRSAAIDDEAKLTAIAIFEAMGTAEAKIHNVELNSVHFHEVGAIDALADIVGASVGARALGVDEILCSPLNVGGGTVSCAHGLFPVPAPATLELLKHAPVYSSGVQAELVTPTGAAIVRTLARRFTAFPAMKVEKIGYGAGTRDLPGQANVVRLTIGEGEPLAVDPLEEPAVETISILEANIDDLNPQVFGYVLDRLVSEGALDVFGLPVQMKKNRPGVLLTVLCRLEDTARLTHLLFRETTTLGIRSRKERREILSRRWVTVGTRWGDVRFKVASRNGTVTNYAPEYEDCKRIASEHLVPLKTVMQEALERYSRSQPGKPE
jgi:hypothetical protein